jgi:hypothetical protein
MKDVQKILEFDLDTALLPPLKLGRSQLPSLTKKSTKDGVHDSFARNTRLEICLGSRIDATDCCHRIVVYLFPSRFCG